MLREVQKVSQGPDLYIVNTHFHPEHTTGEVAFPPSAKVIRAAAQQQDVDEMGMQFVVRFRQRSPEIADLLKDATFRPPARSSRQEKVSIWAASASASLRLGPGHTRGDTVMFVEGDRVLFSGDLAMKDLFPAFASPQSDSRTWLASLDQMAALTRRRSCRPITNSPTLRHRRVSALSHRVAGARRRAQAAGHLRRGSGQAPRGRVQAAVSHLGPAGARPGRRGGGVQELP